MKVILGIDIGGSTTKIVGLIGDSKIGSIQISADDRSASGSEIVDKFLKFYNISYRDVYSIVLTGVGSYLIEDEIYGIKTHKVDEFNAIGYGGLHVSTKKSALIVSMGTGTAYVRASGDSMVHIGGSGVGGGTLLGLSSLLLGIKDVDILEEYFKYGKLRNVDLSVDDICKEPIVGLPPDITASNFGNISSDVSKGDLSLGIINMICQTIGLLAIFYIKNDDIKDIVLTGALSKFSIIRQIFNRLELLHNVKFIIPNDSVFATSIGAIVYHNKFFR